MLVQRQRHHPIRPLKGVLDGVAVVQVQVNVQHSTEAFQQRQNGQDDVVGVAET